jgi:hypothetical protein
VYGIYQQNDDGEKKNKIQPNIKHVLCKRAQSRTRTLSCFSRRLESAGAPADQRRGGAGGIRVGTRQRAAGGLQLLEQQDAAAHGSQRQERVRAHHDRRSAQESGAVQVLPRARYVRELGKLVLLQRVQEVLHLLARVHAWELLDVHVRAMRARS